MVLIRSKPWYFRSYSRTGNLPLWSVLAPQANTIALFGHTRLLVQVYEAGAEVFPPLANGLVVLPDIRTPSLCNGIVRAVAEALVLGVSSGCICSQQ